MTPRSIPAALGAALLAATGMAHAALGVTDPVGDFVSTFTGVKGGDLDVVSTFATYNATTNIFHISGTFAGAVGTTANAIYVFGFDRGLGTERFAPNGYSGVVFDAVVTLLPNLTGTLSTTGTGAAAPAGAAPTNIVVSGNTISADISGTFLPSNGLALGKYTFNLWPRDTSALGGGVSPISDFAPDGANITIAAVPEPETYALFGAGLGMLALMRRRIRNRE